MAIKIIVSNYFFPIKLAKIQAFDKCWQGFEVEAIFLHCW